MNSEIILNFHGIGEPHGGIDDAERPYWISEARFVEMLDQIESHPARGRVRITFDDGKRSDITIAMPLLQERGYCGEFFILTGRFDDSDYVSREDCRALVAGGMVVGLHGRHHVNWRALDREGFADETVAARAELEAVIGQPVRSVAIPYGRYNRGVIARLTAQGFDTIYTTDGGESAAGQRVRNRTTLRSDTTDQRFARLLDGIEPLKPRLRRAVSTFLRRHVV